MSTTTWLGKESGPSVCIYHSISIERRKAMHNTFLRTLIWSLLLAVPASAETLILNGSFEMPPIAANSASHTLPTSWLGMQSDPNADHSIINGDYSPGYPLPQEGQQYLALGHGGAQLTQDFTVSQSGTYKLAWFDSSEFNGPNNHSPYLVTVTDASANVVASASFDANPLSLRQWTQRSMELTLAPTTYSLRFQGDAPVFGEGTLLDNVSLTPEPACGALLLCGVGAMLSATRSRLGQ